MLQWNKSSLETHVLWCSRLRPLGFVMLLYYPACCFEVKENAYFIVAAGNTKDILPEKVLCIQSTLAREIIGAIVYKLYGEKLGEEKLTFFSRVT